VSRAAVLAAVAVLALACDRTPPASPAGSGPDDDVVSRRVVEHFRKAVTTPGLTFRVTQLDDAEIPGWRKGNLEVALGQQTQNVSFYVSGDGRWLFRGDAVDLTVDPLADVRRKLTLAGRPSQGPADAPVTVVEFTDYQCPFCARAEAALREEVLPGLGDRVRLVVKHLPLTGIHPWAEDAAVAAECAFRQGQDAFWSMHRALYARQAEITRETLRADVLAAARGRRLDASRLEACLRDRATLDAVRADADEAEALGVTSTPTFFVNGRRVTGAQVTEQLAPIIREELRAAGGAEARLQD
jgi:protein-disulfide isomerase